MVPFVYCNFDLYMQKFIPILSTQMLYYLCKKNGCKFLNCNLYCKYKSRSYNMHYYKDSLENIEDLVGPFMLF